MNAITVPPYLRPGLARPAPSTDGLDTPFWDALREEKLLLQRCSGCRHWQWGPEFVCHRCHCLDLVYEETPADFVFEADNHLSHAFRRALARE